MSKPFTRMLPLGLAKSTLFAMDNLDPKQWCQTHGTSAIHAFGDEKVIEKKELTGEKVQEVHRAPSRANRI